MRKNIVTLLLLLNVGLIWSNPRIYSKKDFFEYVNLDYPGLNVCKRNVNIGDYEKAFDAYISFFETRSDRNYFYTPEDFEKRVKYLVKHVPDYVNQILKNADLLNDGIYEIEGEKYEWNNKNIPWRSENKEWINVLNRLYCLHTLYVSYYATKKDKYMETLCNYLWGWIDSNEVPDYDIVLTGGTWQPYRQSYTSPHGPWRALEVGIRVSNMLSAYYAIYSYKMLTKDMKWKFFKSLMEHALYIQSYLKRCANGNWESSVASGFASLCIMTPEWKCSNLLLKNSIQTINNNLKHAFNKDGFQFETTTGYHKHVVEGYIKTEYLFQTLNGINCLDSEGKNVLKKSVEIVALMKKPNGSDPIIGDCTFECGGHKEAIINDNFFVGASLLFKGNNYGIHSDYISPENILNYGIPIKTINVNQSESLSSLYLPDSQLAIMRGNSKNNKSEQKDLYLLFDNAIDGAGAHQHHDFLNIELFAFDRTLIIDPGRGSSYNHPLFTSYYRTVKGHNVIQVGEDSQRQERKKEKESVETLKWETNDNFDFASGIMRNYEGVDIIRNIFFVKGEYWFIWDRIIGDNDKKLTQRFHLPPGDINITYNKYVHTQANDAANISVIPFLKGTEKVYLENGYVFDGKANIWAPIATVEKNADFSFPMAVALYPREKGCSSYNFEADIVVNDETIDYILNFGNGRKDIFTVTSGYDNNQERMVYSRHEQGNVVCQFNIE